MNEQRDPNRQADKLEELLQDFYETPTPPAEFVERLEQQLRARHPASAHQQRPAASAWSRFNLFRSIPMLKQQTRAFVSTTVGLFLLFTLIIGAMALFSSVSQPTASSGVPTPIGPQLRLQGNLRGFNGLPDSSPITVSIRVPQPHFPDQVPLYDIRPGSAQPSVDAARHWAEKLGLKSVRVYHDSSKTNAAYIAQGEDGRIVQLGPDGVINYQTQLSDVPSGTNAQTPIDLVAAQAAAQAFLKGISELVVVEGDSQVQVELRVEPESQQVAWTTTAGAGELAFQSGVTFQYVPVINGIPLRSGGMVEQVFVGRDGKVHNALFMPVRIKPIGKMVTLRPAETVLQEFVNGDQKVISTSGWGGSSAAKAQGAPEKRPFYREPQLIVGDEIEAEGYVQHWVAADGGADQFSILALNGQTLVLEADQLDLAQATDQQEVTVSGRLIEQAGPGFWRMKVSAVTPLSDAASQSDSQGVVRRQSDGVWLETANGQKYVLPDAPAELANGTRVYVPGILVKSADQPLHLEWQIMTPVDETQKPSTSSSGMVIMPASVSRPAEMVQAAPEGSSASSAPTLPAWWTYQPGDEVTLEGELSMQGMRYRSSGGPVQGATTSPDKLFFDASLLVKSDPSSAAYELNVVLVGDAVNLDLLRLSGLTLRVQGRVLSAQEAESRFPNRGAVTPLVEITHYEQANPAETKAIFDGGLRIATVGDRRVAIISDTLSQREYMLADSLAYSETLRMYESMLQGKVTLSLIGVTAPDQTYGGYPIVRTAEIHVNSDGSAEILPQLRERLANPIQDIELESRGPVDAVIDRIELVYVFQWLPPGASPADGSTVADVGYHVTGHSSDNRYTLAYDLRAAVEP